MFLFMFRISICLSIFVLTIGMVSTKNVDKCFAIIIGAGFIIFIALSFFRSKEWIKPIEINSAQNDTSYKSLVNTAISDSLSNYILTRDSSRK